MQYRKKKEQIAFEVMGKWKFSIERTGYAWTLK